MSTEAMQVCLLCDKVLLPEHKRTVKIRAISSLIKASIKRKDNKHVQMKKCTSLDIHANCHTLYLREASIKAALKTASSSTSRIWRTDSEAHSFDFHNFCFFCGDDASDNYIAKTKKYPEKYFKVSRITSSVTQNKILQTIQNSDNSEWYKAVYSRINNVSDLMDQNARYHAKCLTRFYNYRPTNISGRPPDSATATALQFAINYILENDKECQLSLRYIFEEYRDYEGEYEEEINIRYIKDKLIEHFGNNINVTSVKNDYIICFVDFRKKILCDDWYKNRLKDEEDERRRIVETAAHIILQDIRARYYHVENYRSDDIPAPNCFLDNIHSDIPPNLKLLLDILLKSNKKGKCEAQKWDKRVTTYAHCIISSVRPRSMMYKKHAWRNLTDLLPHIGLCAPYEESKELIINEPEESYMMEFEEQKEEEESKELIINEPVSYMMEFEEQKEEEEENKYEPVTVEPHKEENLF